MKHMIAVIAAVVILYSIYYDIRFGTLPANTEISTAIQELETVNKQDDNKKEKKETSLSYFEKKVAPGDTVISIIEEELDDSIPLPITDVVSDFKKLNHDITPAEIQTGKTYKFPDYSKTEKTSNNSN